MNYIHADYTKKDPDAKFLKDLLLEEYEFDVERSCKCPSCQDTIANGIIKVVVS